MPKKKKILHFKIIRKAERFWVQPTRKLKNGFKAIVKNDLLENKYKWGDTITIKNKEIIETKYF